MIALLLTLTTGCASPADGPSPMEDESLDIEAARKRHAETLASQTANGITSERESEPATFDSKLASGDQLRAEGDSARALWAYLQV